MSALSDIADTVLRTNDRQRAQDGGESREEQ
jgi:hypothetical protein